MRKLIIILLSTFIAVGAHAQMTAALTSISNTATTDVVRVEFTATAALSGVDLNPLNIYLKIPGDGSGITWALTSNPMGFVEGSHFSSGGFYYRVYQSLTPQPVSGFPMGTPVTIAEISVTGYDGDIELNAGDFPLPPPNYVGTAAVQAGVNLLTWPIAETVSLPISLRSFDVTKKGDDAAKLNWVTSSEENASHFEVQRSIDGKEWSKIGIVNAAGQSVTEQFYQFDDSNLKAIPNDDKIFYYRLRAVDFDEQYDYSAVKNIKLDYADITLSVYPNPTSEGIWVRMSHPRESREELTYTIVDISGKIIQAGNLGNAKEVNEYIALGKDISTGTYMLSIDTPTTNLRTERIVVVGRQ